MESKNNSLDRRKRQADVGSIANDYGKIPPSAIELEEAVLGALMLEKWAVEVVAEILVADSFYKESNKLIFEAILTLFANSQPTDLLSVTIQLKKLGNLDIVGGAYYITQLTDRVASASNVEFHARVIAQKAIQRNLIRISGETTRNAFDDTTDVFELLDEHISSVTKLSEKAIVSNISSSSELFTNSIKKNELLLLNKGVNGVPSGFKDIDKILGGWQKSDLIIIAARPSMGKTALVLCLLRNASVDFKKPTAIFSLEMSKDQLYSRLQSQESGLPIEKITKIGLDNIEMGIMFDSCQALKNAPIYFEDKPSQTILEITLKARKLKREKGIEMIIIDYLQLMKGSVKGNREQEVSEISRGLKALAKDLDIPVIALSQLSRAVESRGGDKKPMLSDLRESGSIEQDADVVGFLYRPEYYGISETDDGIPTKGFAQLIIAKHRNGGIGEIPLKWTAEQTKFSNWGDNFGSSQFPTMKPNEDFDIAPF